MEVALGALSHSPCEKHKIIVLFSCLWFYSARYLFQIQAVVREAYLCIQIFLNHLSDFPWYFPECWDALLPRGDPRLRA